MADHRPAGQNSPSDQVFDLFRKFVDESHNDRMELYILLVKQMEENLQLAWDLREMETRLHHALAENKLLSEQLDALKAI